MATLVSAGCASNRPPARAVSLEAPGPLAERWRLPYRLLDGRSGATLTDTDLQARLEGARVVYVAERHDSPHDHAVQLQVLAALHRIDPSVGVGMEMFKRPFQKWLSDYVAGRIDEVRLKQRTEWPTRWGFDFALYRPILEFARKHHLPLYALNARDEITRAVARRGLDALPPEDRAALPELDLTDDAHRAEIRAVFDQHGMEGGKMTFENFYTAQVIWDETMAHEVAGELVAAGAPTRILVLAGAGHIRGGRGIPSRAERRGAAPWLSVYPVIPESPQDLDALIDARVADILWVMSPPE